MQPRLYEILQDIGKSTLVDDGDLQAAGLLILTAALQGLAINRVGIWVIQDERQTLRCQMLLDGNDFALDTDIILKRSDYPQYFAALDSERALVASDACQDPKTAEFTSEYLQPNHISAILDVPICHRGQIYGLICCEHQGDLRHWSNEEIAFASALAESYGRAISAAQRNNYERQLQEINEQLEQKIAERTRGLQDALRNLTHTHTQLIESEKLASIGRLVSGLAHEINTPLGIAVTSASHGETQVKHLAGLYRNQTLSEEEFAHILNDLQQSFELLNQNLQRATGLIQNFKLSGSLHTATEQEDFDLRACLELCLKGLGPLLRKHQVNCQLEPGEPLQIHSYPGAFAQIITNLVTNSITHAFDGDNQRQIHLQLSRAGEYAALHYRDSGKGISDDIRAKIFEPFFTTARKEGGSGLGLSIVYNLVTQKLGGEIVVDSDQSQGASFTIGFPLNSIGLPQKQD